MARVIQPVVILHMRAWHVLSEFEMLSKIRCLKFSLIKFTNIYSIQIYYIPSLSAFFLTLVRLGMRSEYPTGNSIPVLTPPVYIWSSLPVHATPAT